MNQLRNAAAKLATSTSTTAAAASSSTSSSTSSDSAAVSDYYFLYFVVPDDVFSAYKHLPSSMIPSTSKLPDNVQLIVLKLPLPKLQQYQLEAVRGEASESAAETPVRVFTLDSMRPMKKQRVGCNCNAGCIDRRCGCVKKVVPCSVNCHQVSSSSTSTMTTCQNIQKRDK